MTDKTKPAEIGNAERVKTLQLESGRSERELADELAYAASEAEMDERLAQWYRYLRRGRRVGAEMLLSTLLPQL